MIQLFIDREEELQFLEERFKSGSPELVVMYGRRRIGKTELVARFMEGKASVYFLVDRRPERELLLELRTKMASALPKLSCKLVPLGIISKKALKLSRSRL